MYLAEMQQGCGGGASKNIGKVANEDAGGDFNEDFGKVFL